MMGSMIDTTWTDVAAAISASVLRTTRRRNEPNERLIKKINTLLHCYPSVFDQSKLGPRTMAMLLGVILFTSLSWASLARNFTRYLWTEHTFDELSLNQGFAAFNTKGVTLVTFWPNNPVRATKSQKNPLHFCFCTFHFHHVAFKH